MSEPKNIYDKVDSVESKMDSMSSKIDGLTLQVQNLLSSDIKKQTQKFPLDKTTNIECSQASKQNTVRKFIASAKKEYIWLGSNQDFAKEHNLEYIVDDMKNVIYCKGMSQGSKGGCAWMKSFVVAPRTVLGISIVLYVNYKGRSQVML